MIPANIEKGKLMSDNYYELTLSSEDIGELKNVLQHIPNGITVEPIITKCEHGTNLSEGFGCDYSGKLNSDGGWISNCTEEK